MTTETAYTLSINEVAASLGVCVNTIRNRMKRLDDHRSIATKIGRRWRFHVGVFTSVVALEG